VADKLCICVIDDDAHVRDALTLTLEDAGHDVISATNGAEGRALLEHQHADVVVTDMNMPGGHGAQLIPVLRVLRPNLPIVAISGEISTHQLTSALSLGADACLSKPFDQKDLHAAIARATIARSRLS
jgi:CheY-like chemotaxis protein